MDKSHFSSGRALYKNLTYWNLYHNRESFVNPLTKKRGEPAFPSSS